MSVAYFKDRLTNAKQINAEREEEREIEEIEKLVWDQSFRELEHWLDRDETIQGTGDRLRPETRMKRMIDKIAEAERRRLGLPDFADWASSDPRLEALKVIEMVKSNTRTSDLRDNFLYQMFGSNVISGGEVRTFAQFSIHMAMRATVRLLAEVHGGENLLRELDADQKVMTAKEHAVRFYEHLKGLQDQLDADIPHDDNTHPLNVVPDPFELANMMRDWIPGIDELAETVLIAYSEAVRMERAKCDASGDRYHDGTLPDESGAIPLRRLLEMWPEELRIEQACLEYMEGNENYKVIATKYRLPHKRFHTIITDRGINRKRGHNFEKGAA